MKHLILLIAIFISSLCNAQIDFVKHHESSIQAKRAFEKKDYAKALTHYETAFAINGAIRPVDYLNAAVCAAQLNNENNCKKWIKASIVNEKLKKKSIINYSENPLYIKCAERVVVNYDKLLEEFYENLPNKAVYFKVENLLNRDQFTRKISNYYLGISEKEQEAAFDSLLALKLPKDSIARRQYKSIVFPKVDKSLKDYESKIYRYTDSLNIREFIEITKEFGYQKEGWLLLWHQRGTYGEDNWVWNTFKPLIDAEIKQGKITTSFWAIFEDITAIRQNGESIYGFHPGKVYPLTVNKKRSKIGLPPLTEEEIELRNNNPYGGSTF